MYNVDQLDNGEWYAQNEDTLDGAEGDTPVDALVALRMKEGVFGDEQ